MPATWNGSTTITISEKPNTIESVYQDLQGINPDLLVLSYEVINDVEYAVFTFHPTLARLVNLSSKAHFSIGEEGNMNNAISVRMPWNGTVDSSRFYTFDGSKFFMWGRSELILNYGCTSTQYPQYAYFYGDVRIVGDGYHNPVLSGGRSHRFYFQSTSEDFIKDSELTLVNMSIGDSFTSPNIYLFVGSYFPRTFNVSNVKVINPTGYTAVMQSMVIINNIPTLTMPPVINLMNDAPGNIVLSSNFYGYLKDTVWVTSYTSYPFTVVGQPRARGEYYPTYLYQLTDEEVLSRKIGQWIDSFLENVDIQTTFAYELYINRLGQLVMKDCPNTNNKNHLIYTGSNLLCWNSPNVYSRLVLDNYGSTAKKVHLLKVIIQDEDENPIENATVKVVQKDEKEVFTGCTGVDGKLISLFNLEGFLLANEVTFSSAKIVEKWSDSSNDTYHTIHVLKDGYEAQEVRVVMNEDKEVIITLSQPTPSILPLNGSVNTLSLNGEVRRV